MWKDCLAEKASAPYMTHMLAGGTLQDLHFCPYEVRGRGRRSAVSLLRLLDRSGCWGCRGGLLLAAPAGH